MAEMIDIYDKNHARTGKILPRENIFSTIDEDDRILLVHVCLFNRYGEMLIQHRHVNKNKYPGMWDVSAGGLVQSGETSEYGMIRELEEELGIDYTQCEFSYLLCEPFKCVLDDFYIGFTDIPSSDFVFQKEEISEVKWASYDAVMEMISTNEFVDYDPQLITRIFNSAFSHNFKFLKNPCESELCDVQPFGKDAAETSLSFHQSLSGYSETPLRNLSEHYSGKVSGVYLKDESLRFNLNAFKALGGSYAVGCLLDSLSKDSFLITATDGNHGRGVAWAANALNLKCKVYLPKGTARERVENIQSLGAQAVVTDLTYDDCVRKARDEAREKGYVLIQDTSWPGYEEIPSNIMRGYLTMALEAVLKLGDKVPTHVFLQAGVGSMAGALTAFFTDYYKDKKPKIVIVEANKADCIYLTAKSNDGRLHSSQGELDTIMAGLACGEVCSVSWPIMRDYADYFVSIPDYIAAKGMRVLSRFSVISGESGAAGFAAFHEMLENPVLHECRDELGLDNSSTVLCFSTEGATDKAGYDRVILGEDL